jgi:hypothetical protein
MMHTFSCAGSITIKHYCPRRQKLIFICNTSGLLSNMLVRHLHLMGLKDSPLCRGCGAEDETSAHVLCRCEALASSRHAHLGSFFLEPADIKRLTPGAIWRFARAAGLL